ncbi:hypothetical protein HMPREF1581_00558 [Gardnerella vaginalis JCP8108]|uniref:Uncharacterized protein n=1 Tax=Gardnerella vaginalis JCP8108 TaxID=1261066 RepID=S4GZR2_GARVA|nr:hypothetical protein HMPREF1581_00558 [Gardnerella vaginalis JCP8108]
MVFCHYVCTCALVFLWFLHVFCTFLSFLQASVIFSYIAN